MAVVEYMGYTAGELIPVERLIDPANALTAASKAVLGPEEKCAQDSALCGDRDKTR